MLLFENEKKLNKASKLVKVVLFLLYFTHWNSFLKKVCTHLLSDPKGNRESPDVSQDKVKGNIGIQVIEGKTKVTGFLRHLCITITFIYTVQIQPYSFQMRLIYGVYRVVPLWRV